MIYSIYQILPRPWHTFPDSHLLCSVFKLDKPKRIGRIKKSDIGTKIHQLKVIPSVGSYHFHWRKKITVNVNSNHNLSGENVLGTVFYNLINNLYHTEVLKPLSYVSVSKCYCNFFSSISFFSGFNFCGNEVLFTLKIQQFSNIGSSLFYTIHRLP